jgi:two-component system, OmpR family, alkaline phosphatase synthesis response regulator PhoP
MSEAPPKIVVIDDDPFIVEVVSMSLMHIGGFEVLSAQSGEVGIELCVQEQPIAVVVDVGMPQLDGYQVVRALRGDPKTADMPIIMLTARVEEIDQTIASLSGADFYLRKPLNPWQLVQAITNAINISQNERNKRTLFMANAPTPDPAATSEADIKLPFTALPDEGEPVE